MFAFVNRSMSIFYTLGAICFILSLNLVAASSSFDYSLRTRNAPGSSDLDTYKAIRRELSKAAAEKRTDLKSNSTIALDTSFDGVVLFA
jgi:hypothetical protein